MAAAYHDDAPAANLEIIDLSQLLLGDPTEQQKLFHACVSTGFFYLGLSGHDSLESGWQKLLDFSQDYFALPEDDKIKDARGSDIYGYEPAGTSAGVKPGSVDGYESLSIPQHQFNMDGQPLSCAVRKEDALLGSFISAAHAVLLTVLDSLCELLKEDTHHLLMDSHSLEESSTSTLALFRYLRGPDKEAQGHNKHTDLGTLTFLLTKQRGLQVLLPGHEGWFSVEPRLGCAIINVGDSLRFLSGRKLLSAVHRVVPVAENATHDRYSIAYFLRPNDRIMLKDSSGRDITAREWHDFKFDVFRQPHEEQERGRYSTGGMTSGDRLVAKG